MVRARTISIVPHHIPVGDGVVHEEYAIYCTCGYYDKAGDHSTRAGRKRAATYAAMNHNTQAHSYTYEIQGGSA